MIKPVGTGGSAQRSAVVLDVGKTNTKLTLWDARGTLLDRRVRANDIVRAEGYRALDVQGIEDWMADVLREYTRGSDVGALIPVAHGAAAALVLQNRLFTPPMDYEDDPSADERREYDAQRDAFADTGSPALPHGLNLGIQLHRLERMTGPWPGELSILCWPQYWAWRLSQVQAAEITSLGCHSDLWWHQENCYSNLARRRGWAQRMPPLRHAGEPLGTVTSEWVDRTGLAADCVVYCGLHDSNSALLAARGHAEIAYSDTTVLSTGTWFVAMRSGVAGTRLDTAALAETRDCLINVDISGLPVPSARFMGGREVELISGSSVVEHYDPLQLIERLPALLASGVAALPTFVRGCGPFPHAIPKWRSRPGDPRDRRALAELYLALMADASLDLIGSRDRLVVEGRFAEATLFVRALARLRGRQRVFVSDAQDDVSYGALRLVDGKLPPPCPLTEIAPLEVDLGEYAERWRAHALRASR